MCIWLVYCDNEKPSQEVIDVSIAKTVFNKSWDLNLFLTLWSLLFFTLFQVWPRDSHISWVGGLFSHPLRGRVLHRDGLPSNHSREVLKIPHIHCFIASSEAQRWPSSPFWSAQHSRVCLWRRNVHGPSFQRQNPVHGLLQTLQALRILHGLRTIWQLQDLKDLSDDANEKLRPGRIRVRAFARGGVGEICSLYLTL